MLQLRDQPTNAAAAAAALNQTIAALDRALALSPGHAECCALLGTTYGMKIDGSLLQAIRFGPKVASNRNLAVESGADNPRVQFLLGMCQFHTARKPAAWREALTTLTKAEALFTAEEKKTPTPLEPRWGHDTCLAFIGRVHECLGERDLAAEFYRKALKLHPQHHIAEAGLKRLGLEKDK